MPQCVVSLHGQFGTQHHRRSAAELLGSRTLSRLQRRQSPEGRCAPTGAYVLNRNHIPTANARSKSWDEFATPDAPPLDFVFTVCDNAAREICPVWPGQPMTAHWGIVDPAAVEGTDDEKRRAFNNAFRELDARLKIFTSLRLEKLDKMSLQRQLDAIGQMPEERQLK